MGTPAAVLGDRVTGTCAGHLVPGPMGAPQPGPPIPFSAPLTEGLVPTVVVGGKPAAVLGSAGVNVPPHVGLHPTDPHFAPPLQRAVVTAGSATVLIGGKPAARTGSTCTKCLGQPGVLTGSVATVLVGG